MPNRTVLIVSGLQFVGKSWLLQRILTENLLPNTKLLSLDDVRVLLYGDREDASITHSEHLFKNEWLRYEILHSIITTQSNLAIEAVMLTRKDHQAPMHSIIESAKLHLKSIEEEKNIKNTTKVTLKVLLLYSNPRIILDRISRDQTERMKTNSPIYDIKGMWNAYSQFEFPNGGLYEPLYLDTSDETDAACESRLMEIREFIYDGHISEIEQNLRKKEARKSYTEMLSIIKKSLLT